LSAAGSTQCAWSVTKNASRQWTAADTVRLQVIPLSPIGARVVLFPK
jgi:hypothetical protein